MLVRIRSKEGTSRIEVDENDDILVLRDKIAIVLNVYDPTTITMSNEPSKGGTSITELSGQTIKQLGIEHGDLLFATFVDNPAPGPSAVAVGKQPETKLKKTAEATKKLQPSLLTVNQDPVDDFLDKQDGLIKRGRDPKFCKHTSNGMCDYCMPLEPYDANYLAENRIKHMSFHSYLRKIHKEYSRTTSTNIPPLEESDYRVRENCTNGHAPWPEGICTKCQPSAVTLQQQQFRMVDHVEFSVSSLINNFINFWRSSGCQRFGYLYGRYEPYPDVPLGIKVVVEAIYEPPQENKIDGLTLTLPWDGESLVDEAASACGLVKVGMIYTDLNDDGSGQGKVVCKRHIDSYFLSSQECCFSAAIQNKHPNTTKWSASGKFGSKFVTCVITGNENGDIDVNAYQVSNICAAMVSADIIEPSVEPSVMRVKESNLDRYVPEVFYKYKNKYGVNVQESAKPCFPVEYLLVNVTHGFPSSPNPRFISPTAFPIENRQGFESQDLKKVLKHLGTESSTASLTKAVSDFHLLAYIKGTSILDKDEFSLLAKLAVSHSESDAIALSESSGWQTLVTIINVT